MFQNNNFYIYFGRQFAYIKINEINIDKLNFMNQNRISFYNVVKEIGMPSSMIFKNLESQRIFIILFRQKEIVVSGKPDQSQDDANLQNIEIENIDFQVDALYKKKRDLKSSGQGEEKINHNFIRFYYGKSPRCPICPEAKSAAESTDYMKDNLIIYSFMVLVLSVCLVYFNCMLCSKLPREENRIQEGNMLKIDDVEDRQVRQQEM